LQEAPALEPLRRYLRAEKRSRNRRCNRWRRRDRCCARHQRQGNPLRSRNSFEFHPGQFSPDVKHVREQIGLLWLTAMRGIRRGCPVESREPPKSAVRRTRPGGQTRIPVSERAIGCNQNRSTLAAAIDDVIKQIGGIVVIGQISDFIDTKRMRSGIEVEALTATVGNRNGGLRESWRRCGTEPSRRQARRRVRCFY
jgi:hypothetical protein